VAVIAAAAAAVIWSVPMLGQPRTPPWAASLPDASVVKMVIASQVQKGWAPAKTPWGDPDIQGNVTTKDEANTPFERPEEWAGRKMAAISSSCDKPMHPF
jgi:hypothetical protein